MKYCWKWMLSALLALALLGAGALAATDVTAEPNGGILELEDGALPVECEATEVVLELEDGELIVEDGALPAVVEDGFAVFEEDAEAMERDAAQPTAAGVVVSNGDASSDFEITSDCLTKYNGPGGDVIIPRDVTKIGQGAFSGCTQLTSVSLPWYLSSIEDNAFSGCVNLTSVVIPPEVRKIGKDAFSGCAGLTHLSFEPMPTYFDPSIRTRLIDDGAFRNCTALEAVEITPEFSGINKIGAYAFAGCTSLTGFDFPDCLGSIGKGAFSGCTSLTGITLDSVVIYDGAFSGCRNLANVYVGYGMVAEGEDSWFDGCASGLTFHMRCYCSIDQWAKDKGFRVEQESHETTHYDGMEPTCTEEGYTDYEVCDKCGREIKPCETIPALGHDPVVDPAVAPTCTGTGLTEGSHCKRCNEVLKAQEKVEATGHSWAYDRPVEATCTETGLTSGTHCQVCGLVSLAQEKTPALGHSLYKIDGFEPTCTTPGKRDSYKCMTCEMVVSGGEAIPATGHTPEADPREEPTYTQTGLTEGSHCVVCGAVLVAQQEIPMLEMTDEVAFEISNNTLVKYKGLGGDVVVPKGVQYIGQNAFQDITTVTSVTLPNSVTHIGQMAFQGCSLKQINLPDGLGCIKDYAFMGSGLTSVTIPARISSLGQGIFDWCDSLREINVHSDTYAARWIQNYRQNNYPINLVPHTLVTDKAVAATYTRTGLTEGSHCSVCGKVEVAQQVVAKLTPTPTPTPDSKVKLSKCTITVKDQIYTGKALKPAVTVKYGKTKLVKGTDYTVTYANNKKVGTATVTVKGKGNYTGTVKVTFAIRISLSKCTATVKAQTYTGKALKPAVTVKYGKKTLKKGTDYTVTYKNNKAVGTATATVKGKGSYTGTKTVSFKINPKGAALSRLTAGTRQFTAKWKKVSGVTGYQVSYSLKSDFTGSKTVKVKKAATVGATVKNLKKGKKYYVRIRTYKTVNKKDYYSAWSKAKTVTVK